MANEQFFEALQEKKKEKSKGRNKKPVHESDTDSDSSILNMTKLIIPIVKMIQKC